MLRPGSDPNTSQWVCLLASLLLAAPLGAAEIPWPAESLTEATNLTHVEGAGANDFHVNLSGAFWNPDTRRLWTCRNGGTGGSKFWALREDGSGSFEIDYKSGLRGEWTNFGDLEAITQANYGEEVVYLLIEGEERIKEFDVSTYGTAVLRNNWNTTPHLPLNGGSGAEGLAFVPDSFLVAQGFVDGSGNPYVSQNGMGGLMFVAHQNGGRVYAFDLNRTNGTFTFVGAYRTNYGESCELTFDRSDGRFYILHGANWNRLEVTTLGSTLVSGERRLNELFTYSRPTGSPSDWNLEGFAVLPNQDCVGGTRSAFLTIDDGGATSLLWYKDFPCTCDSTDSDGDGVSDCDDLCPSTPGGAGVDSSGCACGQGDRTGPDITAHPASTSICSGQSAQVCVTATSTAGLSYQWQRNGINLSGATSACHTVDQAGNYRCIVTDECGSVTSNIATITVTTPVSISAHPAGNTVCPGQTHQFCVTAGGTTPITYQWQRDGANISGATSSCYTSGQAGVYRCVVTNPCGSVASNTATLAVQSAPAVSTHPSSGSLCSGNDLQLCVTASGTGPLSYQWQRNSVNIGGATGSCYSATLAGTYRCIVTNACGQATSNNATVTVATAPSISGHPSSAAVCSGQTQQFCVTASGSTPLTYQWERDGVNLGGATSSCYTASLAGTYRCTVTNSCGSVQSNAAVLTINTAPTISAHPISSTICSGSTYQFCVTASGSPAPTYQWQRNGMNIAGATSACLTASLAGTYRCVVTNTCGSVTSSNATLTVQSSMLWYADADDDGFGNPSVFTSGCDQPQGYVSNNLDCDDSNPDVNPSAQDVCGVDRNCDGLFPVPSPWFRDADSDGYGNPLDTVLACSQPSGYVENDLDCNDANPDQYPDAAELCDGIDNDCDGIVDNDADTDWDGVWDCLDQCPNTPPGLSVGADGCSCAQVFTSEDSDGDGVIDCYDFCPDTPPGQPVNSQGCSCIQLNPTGDADSDGVLDCIDTCPNTPPNLPVDANGCHCIQLNPTDDDGDGVPNCFDACPLTPRGTPVSPNGCPLPVSDGNSQVDSASGGGQAGRPGSEDPVENLISGAGASGGSLCGAGMAAPSLIAAFAALVGASSHLNRRRVRRVCRRKS